MKLYFCKHYTKSTLTKPVKYVTSFVNIFRKKRIKITA